MNEDIIITVAKRTVTEVATQIKETPFIVAPFALAGLVYTSFYGIIAVAIIILAYIAYTEYKELIIEIETDVKAASFPDDTNTPAQPVEHAQAEPTVVVEEPKDK